MGRQFSPSHAWLCPSVFEMNAPSDASDYASVKLRAVPIRLLLTAAVLSLGTFGIALVGILVSASIADSLVPFLVLCAFVGVPLFAVVGIVLSLTCVITVICERPGYIRKTVRFGRLLVWCAEYRCNRIAWKQETSYSSNSGGYSRNLTACAVCREGDTRVLLSSMEAWLLGFDFVRGRGIMLRGKPLPPILTPNERA